MSLHARRIVIVVENLPVPFDRRVWMEATTLAAAGHEVHVCSPVGKGFETPFETREKVHIHRHAMPPEAQSAKGYLREYAGALIQERRILKRIRADGPIDAIHLCNPPDVLFLVALPYRLLGGTRIVFDQHDINPELWEAKYDTRGFYYRALRLAERLTYAAAHRVIVTNESYREIALERGKKRAADVTIVRSAPDLSRFSPVSPTPAYRRGARFLVGYVGVMGEQEGIDHLLRAAADIVHARGRRDVRFCLIGAGPVLDELKTLARDLDLDDHVEFTGRVSDEELIARLSTCDVCVNPDPKTPFNDKSTMNKILEYMALGRPIVQYDLTEGRRSAGEASAYAEPGNDMSLAEGILGLLADDGVRERMGAAGLQRMRDQLEWRHQAPRLLNCYENLFDPSGNNK